MRRTAFPVFSFALYSGAMYIDGGGEWRYMKFPDPGYMWVMVEMVVLQQQIRKEKLPFVTFPLL